MLDAGGRPASAGAERRRCGRWCSRSTRYARRSQRWRSRSWRVATGSSGDAAARRHPRRRRLDRARDRRCDRRRQAVRLGPRLRRLVRASTPRQYIRAPAKGATRASVARATSGCASCSRSAPARSCATPARAPIAPRQWQRGILARRPVKVAVLAQAAKTARIAWAILVSGETWQPRKTAAA